MYRILKDIVPDNDKQRTPAYFLRRLVTSPHLPDHLRQNVQQDNCSTVHLLIPPPLPPVADVIVTFLAAEIEFEQAPAVRTIQIPLDPPTTSEQAVLWSKNYWPCIFNPASQAQQKAPPLHVLRTVQTELNKEAVLESYFGLAHVAAAESVQSHAGREVGAVVIDPVKEEVIAVAGDARWFGLTADPANGDIHSRQFPDGRPEHHALMRAIAMVSRIEEHRRSGDKILPHAMDQNDDSDLRGRSITPIEKLYADTNVEVSGPTQRFVKLPKPQSAERPDAYLCNGLDVYLTHEPCVACSMAMIHSRIRTCIFQRRMPGTGGLCAEKDDAGLGYGLFWRKELNWRVLTFQYFPAGADPDGSNGEMGVRADRHVGPMFHA